VVQDLAEYLIELSDIALAPYRIPALRLDHAPDRHDVGRV
jgi:hypothetical protein